MKMLTVSALVCAMMVLTGAAERSDSCSTGWFPINGRWFHLVPEPMTWAEAEKNCQSLGGTLASIQSPLEYLEIQKLTGEKTWIGGSDAQKEGEWLWTDGSPFNYNNWCPEEPNNGHDGQNCLQINHEAEKCWDDLECTFKLPSLCVYKILKV